ncbi:hypothetical protein G5V59_15265 [Nocardioides sp. W3-2-3]|nr:hypothetical protein [Nocardioides convexus]
MRQGPGGWLTAHRAHWDAPTPDPAHQEHDEHRERPSPRREEPARGPRADGRRGRLRAGAGGWASSCCTTSSASTRC